MTEQPTAPDQPDRPEQPGGPEQPQPSRPAPAGGDPERRLLRSRSDRMIAGVCGGLAEYLRIDPTLVRILVVVGTVIGFGSLVLAYVVGWVLIPEAD
jgi:phage shock protein C